MTSYQWTETYIHWIIPLQEAGTWVFKFAFHETGGNHREPRRSMPTPDALLVSFLLVHTYSKNFFAALWGAAGGRLFFITVQHHIFPAAPSKQQTNDALDVLVQRPLEHESP
ncbi:unnamed protein product [Ectocarpus sp. 8 AP-2014]